MIVAWRRDGLAGLEGALAVCVGVFDGVHRGHQAVFRALAREAAAEGARSLVVTLHPHPLEVVRPGAEPPLLTTPSERVRLIERKGGPPDAVLVHRFDGEIAALGPGAFLSRLVPSGARLAVLVAGYDFRMGRDRSGGYEELSARGEREGFRVVRVRPSLGDGDPVSSSRIRALVAEGRVREAAELLGHRYVVEGRVVPGRGVGRTLDFPTANVDVGERRKLLPGFGVYAVLVRILGGEDRPPALEGVMNRGVRPTFGPSDPVLEVHLPGFAGDLVGAELSIELVDRIRGERAFPGPEALAERISADVEEARKILRERD